MIYHQKPANSGLLMSYTICLVKFEKPIAKNLLLKAYRQKSL